VTRGYWCATDVLEAVRDQLPIPLVSAVQVEQARRAADYLGNAARSYYLEFRFSDERQVDFLALVRDERALRASLKQRPDVARCSCWSRVVTFLDYWADDAGRAIPFGWFEFDGRADGAAHAPRPNPAFGLEPGYFGRHWRCPTPAAPEIALRVAVGASECLFIGRSVESFSHVVRRVSLELPAGGSLICCTAMIAREPAVMKLYVSLPKPELGDYLRRIGWPGDVELVRRMVEEYFARAKTLFIDLTSAPELRPSLGLAWSQFHRRESGRYEVRADWGRRSGGSRVKFEAARSWEGIFETSIRGERAWIRKWLDLKLVLPEKGESFAKGYLGFMPLVPLPFA